MRPKNFLEALNCAGEGIIVALKNERHLKVHFILLLLVILIALSLNISLTDFCLLIILSGIVIMAELVNTAIESILDMLTRDFHITVKYIKDISAGAVLFVSMISLLVGSLILSKYIILNQSYNVSENPLFLSSIAIFLTVIFVVYFKALLRKGRPFRGGMPSGHSAISFSIFVSVLMSVDNLFVISSVLILVLFVSLSRYFLGIHKMGEVIFGALLGSSLTYLLFKVFYK